MQQHIKPHNEPSKDIRKENRLDWQTVGAHAQGPGGNLRKPITRLS